MKLVNREQIEKLSKFKSENFLTTSFYLDTNKSRMTKKVITLSLKNLINEGKSKLEKMEISKRNKESLSEDLEKINQFSPQNLAIQNPAGLAIFSCQGEEFWQVFHLPNPPRNRVIFDQNAYVRPLSAALGEHRQVCTLTLDRKKAEWYEIFMGEISSLESMLGNVPSKVKEGGWEGYESKRIERHIATHLHDYLKKAAKKTFELFKKNSFDWLFLGCKEEYFSIFEPLLHPYLKTRLKGRLKAKPGDPPDRILKESLELEKTLKKEEEEDIVNHLISELKKGGLATSGLKQTVRSLNRGEVQTLVVTRSFSKPGRICSKCNFLFVDEPRCLSCQKRTEVLVDIIDEAVEAAMDKNCQVKHITGPSPLRRYGNIGAFLRYKA